MRVKDKVAVVTGAGSGMGLAVARLFVEQGARVVAADWHGEAVATAAAAIGGSIVPITVDVSDEAQCSGMIIDLGRPHVFRAAYNKCGAAWSGCSPRRPRRGGT